jgi:hypothetical protein
MAGDEHVVAFREGHGGKRADRLPDHVAAGVSTLKAVPAKASPPGAPTSFKVTVAARWFRVASVTRQPPPSCPSA